MDRLSSLFAKRYLFSPKSHSVINIISRVCSVAVGVPVAAMVILLSVFNGFEGLVKSMYQEFDPDIAITSVEGKVFDISGEEIKNLYDIKGITGISSIIEENALVEYRGRQYISTLRGVDSLYSEVVPIKDMITEGNYDLYFGDIQQAVVGQGIAYNLGIRTALLDPIKIFVPRRTGSFSSLLPIDSYREGRLFPAGIFTLDAETDGKYILVPITFARELFDYPTQISSLMVKVAAGENPDKLRSELQNTLGDQYKVQTRYQQKASLYKIMTYEKWGIFVIIFMVLVIASFSIIGSLVMLVIDKRADIRTMVNLGSSIEFVRKIFVKEGMLISSLGAMGGLILGLSLCFIQMGFGIIKIPADTFLVDSYPVVVQVKDIIAVILSFIGVSYVISKFTVIKMIPKSDIRI